MREVCTWGLTLRSLEGFHRGLCVRVVFKGCDVRWNWWCHQNKLKTAPTYLVQNRITYTIFHIIKTQEATANIERLQQHESLDTTRSAARIVLSRRKKQHNMENWLGNTYCHTFTVDELPTGAMVTPPSPLWLISSFSHSWGDLNMPRNRCTVPCACPRCLPTFVTL